MSVLSNFASGFRKFLSPSMAVPRLRILYFATLAALAVTLLVAHGLVAREHREARLLAVATNACQLPARLPVIFVRPPTRATVKTQPNFHRTPAAPQRKEK